MPQIISPSYTHVSSYTVWRIHPSRQTHSFGEFNSLKRFAKCVYIHHNVRGSCPLHVSCGPSHRIVQKNNTQCMGHIQKLWKSIWKLLYQRVFQSWKLLAFLSTLVIRWCLQFPIDWLKHGPPFYETQFDPNPLQTTLFYLEWMLWI
jgi:hypothetical protein